MSSGGGRGAHPLPVLRCWGRWPPHVSRLVRVGDRGITAWSSYRGGRPTLTARALRCLTLPPPGVDNDHSMARSAYNWRSPVQWRVQPPLAAKTISRRPLIPPFRQGGRGSRPPPSPATKTGKNFKCQKLSSLLAGAPRRSQRARSAGPARRGHPARHAYGF